MTHSYAKKSKCPEENVHLKKVFPKVIVPKVNELLITGIKCMCNVNSNGLRHYAKSLQSQENFIDLVLPSLSLTLSKLCTVLIETYLGLFRISMMELFVKPFKNF